MSPIVVKLGGSLYDSPELTTWLTKLAEYAQKQAVIIVPGGGPFADGIRAAQALHGFSDKIAHHMALLAMKQFGLLLIGLASNCQAFTISPPTQAALSVWLPDDSLLLDSSIEQSWDISSDSLALWLTQRISAQQLLLIKRSQTSEYSIGQLTKSGILDQGFSKLFSKNPVTAKVIHYKNHSQLDSYSSDLQQSLSLP